MELSQAHEIIYSHLLDLHRQDPSFRFLLDSTAPITPFSSIKEGKNILISFWGGEKSEHYARFSPIAMRINLDTSEAWINITAESNYILGYGYFIEMAKALNYIRIDRNILPYHWEKKLIFYKNDYKNLIDNFIQTDKKDIDNYLNKRPLNFAWSKVISESDFEKNIALNEGCIETYLNNQDKNRRNCVLKYLSVKNYQGIKSLTLNNLPNDAQWIFLTGENGYGKTSVLRAIAKGLLGDEELVTQINKETKISSSIINSFGLVHPKLVEKGIRIYYNPPSVNIAGYGIDRFRHNEKNYGDAYTLFEDSGTLLSIEKLLITADEIAFEKIKNIFKRIIPNLSDIKKINKNGFYEIRYQERNEKGDSFDFVELRDLAAGYRGIITMIGDMMRRFNNYLQQSFDEVTGIVIIDEFDAHLHPKYQYELPKLLSTVFPKIQFIVSTHSPIPLLGVEPNTAVVLTVNRTKELGITIDRLDDEIDIDRLSANALLTSDIFGFKTIFARGATPDTIEPFDDYKDIKEMNDLEKRMELKQGFKDLNIKIG